METNDKKKTTNKTNDKKQGYKLEGEVQWTWRNIKNLHQQETTILFYSDVKL